MRIHHISLIRLLRNALALLVILSVIVLGAAYFQGKLEAPVMKRYEPIWQGNAYSPASGRSFFSLALKWKRNSAKNIEYNRICVSQQTRRQL